VVFLIPGEQRSYGIIYRCVANEAITEAVAAEQEEQKLDQWRMGLKRLLYGVKQTLRIFDTRIYDPKELAKKLSLFCSFRYRLIRAAPVQMYSKGILQQFTVV
jgi:hypothetical protein